MESPAQEYDQVGGVAIYWREQVLLHQQVHFTAPCMNCLLVLSSNGVSFFLLVFFYEEVLIISHSNVGIYNTEK